MMSIKSKIHLSLLLMEQEFEDYLKKKKIDPEAFKANERETYVEFEQQFLSMHPDSFTMQKLFYINIIRRKYHFEGVVGRKDTIGQRPQPVVAKPSPSKPAIAKMPKPVAKPKMSKPKIGEKKTDNDEELKKPVNQRPVVRPKVKTAEIEENKPGEEKKIKKPVIKPRPVVKPKIKSSEENKNDNSGSSEAPKPKKPITKPRISKPKKEE